MANYIVGVMGKKGSGKSFLVKQLLPSIERYIVIDTLHEYNGVIFHNADDILDYLKEAPDRRFRIIFRPLSDEETERVFDITTLVNNYTLIAEEVDLHCNAYNINPNLDYNVRYGRHYNRNIIWLTRSPYEINRFLTRQSDLLITFRQTEPRDLDYLKKYSWNVPFDKLKDLPQYKYAYHLDNPQGEYILSQFPHSGRMPDETNVSAAADKRETNVSEKSEKNQEKSDKNVKSDEIVEKELDN